MTKLSTVESFILVRTEFEGWHFYPDAGKIDPRIQFLENSHRHIFKVSAKIQVFHNDREIEFFMAKWFINSVIQESDMNYKSCEMIATEILDKLIDKYGSHRKMIVTVSEDGESDGIIEYTPK